MSRKIEKLHCHLRSHIFQGFWTVPPVLEVVQKFGGRDYVASGGGRAFSSTFFFCHLTEIPSPIPKLLPKTRPNKFPNPPRRPSIRTSYYPAPHSPAYKIQKSHQQSTNRINRTPTK